MTADRDLDAWLRYLETRHTQKIELGLERVATVAAALDIDFSGCCVVTVAGTNGKGSCVAMLDAALRAVGLRTGCYTSPHLQHFSERARIDGAVAPDAALCEAFARVEAAAGATALTWFEFTTLAVLTVLARAAPDVCILEVGLGGRLDAVNIIDADVALVTAIGLDHTDWLGDDREAIGREKAGIFRSGGMAVCADPDPPGSIAAYADEIGTTLLQRGVDFDLRRGVWSGIDATGAASELPLPVCALAEDNVAGVLQVLQVLPLAFDRAAAAAAISGLSLPGRQQRIDHRGIDVVLDVAHNADAVRRLADWLDDNPVNGRTFALFAAMADKPVAEMLAIIAPRVHSWWLCDLPDTTRAMPAAQIMERLSAVANSGDMKIVHLAEARAALDTALAAQDRLLVFGSFYLVGPMLSLLDFAADSGNTPEAQHA